MYCGKCGKMVESTSGICYSCEPQRIFVVENPLRNYDYCPYCLCDLSENANLRTKVEQLTRERDMAVKELGDTARKWGYTLAEMYRLNGYLCRAKMTLLEAATFLEAEPEGAKDMIAEIRNIWKESGPCLHWAKADRLQKAIDWAEKECTKGELHARTLILELRRKVEEG